MVTVCSSTMIYHSLTCAGSVWVGDIKSQVYSEPFTSSGRGYIYFTSYHQTPTGGQYAYIFPNDTKPLGLTIPHSSSLPAGTNATDQAFNCNGSPCSVSPRGNYLNFYGENKFIGCQDEAAAAIRSYKVYWGGGAAAPEGLNCTGPLYIYQYKELS